MGTQQGRRYIGNRLFRLAGEELQTATASFRRQREELSEARGRVKFHPKLPTSEASFTVGVVQPELLRLLDHCAYRP